MKALGQGEGKRKTRTLPARLRRGVAWPPGRRRRNWDCGARRGGARSYRACEVWGGGEGEGVGTVLEAAGKRLSDGGDASGQGAEPD